MQLPVRNVQGEVVEQVELRDEVFAVPMNRALLHQAMVICQANQRQGTHSTKTRGQVSGGGRKPWAQKHTGRARQGTIRAPQWRKGGIVFGPHPRDYRQRLPRRMRRLAILCALSEKVRGERLVLVQALEMEQPKTKEMARTLRDLGVETSTLVVVERPNPGVSRSVRNLERVKTLTADVLNVLDLLRFDRVVMTVGAARRAEALWAPTPAEASPAA
ncbi:MAG: 50S ribosomal protein L4 [Chloroflexi bacterium]|nr:50S ribosomal protein L4 [Chloroflexota bacterium]